MSESGYLRLYRPFRWIGWSLYFEIKIDGESVGRIGTRETKSFVLPSGSHTVQVKRITVASTEWRVLLHPAEQVLLVVLSSMAGDVKLALPTLKDWAKCQKVRQVK